MSLEARLQTITPLWSWIPAFRAVAETEHLPSAARLLGVGPSTLSRSISLLEAALRRPLFKRTGRSLQLNADGRELLVVVRDAMRLLEDGVTAADSGGLRGVIMVASGGVATTALVAPAIIELRQRHPLLQPHLLTRPALDVASDLLCGRLDVAFQETGVQREGLVTTKVGAIARSVYCGRSHPLYGKQQVDLADLENAEFVAPPMDNQGSIPDGWPPEMSRRIAMVTDQLRVGVDLCIGMSLLAVLPDALVNARGDQVHRLPIDIVSPAVLYAMHRRVLGQSQPAAVQLVELVQHRSHLLV